MANTIIYTAYVSIALLFLSFLNYHFAHWLLEDGSRIDAAFVTFFAVVLEVTIIIVIGYIIHDWPQSQ